MKRKILLVIILAILLFLYPIPFLEEFKKIELNLAGLCIGTGCHSESGYHGGFGTMYCRGYQMLGFFCPADAEKYCRYMKPFDSKEKCLCELKDYGYSYRSHRFCEKNNICYSNSFEYEFGCSENLEKTCRETEKVFTEPNACIKWWDSAESYGLVHSKSECLKSWSNIYIYADDAQRENIFNKELNDECILFCKNCNSALCNQGNICEYVNYPINNTLQTTTQTTTSTTTTLDKIIEILAIRISYSHAKISRKGRMESLQAYQLSPITQGESITKNIQINQYDKYIEISLHLGGSDLDLHLYSPSGEHIGFNYLSDSIDLMANSTYKVEKTVERITIQNPESGNWTIQIYGKNISQEYEIGEPYGLGVSIVGDYKPNLIAGIMAKTSTLNEFTSISVSIRNIGDASAYNLSAIFYSDSFNITERIILKSLEPDVGLNTEINALPLVLGNATVYLNLTYYDSDGNQYNLVNATIMQIVTNPRLYIYLDYSPANPTTEDLIRFNITLINIGSNTAYRINLTTQLDSGINAITPTNFSLANLLAEDSADFSFDATASAGRFYARAYAYYENENRRLFLAGSNEIEIRVEKFSHSIDLDRDSVDEYAENNTYIDPNNNSVALKQMDFNDDNSIDFLIDINNDNIAEIFYDPKNGFIRYGVKFELYNKTPLLFSVEKNVNLDNLIYYDPERDIITKLKRYNVTAYYIDKDGDGIFDIIYDLFTKTATDLHK